MVPGSIIYFVHVLCVSYKRQFCKDASSRIAAHPIYEAILMTKLNELCEYGPRILATGMSGIDGWDRAWGAMLKELYKQRFAAEPPELGYLFVQAWMAEIAQVPQVFLGKDETKREIPLYENVLELLREVVKDVRTGLPSKVIRPHCLKASSSCIDICNMAPQRAAEINCVAEILDLLDWDDIANSFLTYVETNTSDLKSEMKTGITTVALLVYAIVKRCMLILENCYGLIQTNSRNLVEMRRVSHHHRMMLVIVDKRDMRNFGVPQHRERIGMFVAPYEGEGNVAELTSEETARSKLANGTMDIIAGPCHLNISEFLRSAHDEFPIQVKKAKKPRSDTGISTRDGVSDADWMKFFKTQCESNEVAFEICKDPVDVPPDDMDADAGFWMLPGTPARSVVMMHDKIAAKNGEPHKPVGKLLQVASGACRVVESDGHSMCIGTKSIIFDRETRFPLAKQTYFCLQGWDPKEFPQLATTSLTNTIKLAGDAIPATFDAALLVAMLIAFEVPKVHKQDHLEFLFGSTAVASSSSSSHEAAPSRSRRKSGPIQQLD